MHYIRECGRKEQAIIAKIEQRYGSHYKILSRNPTIIRSLYGILAHRGWEYTVCVDDEKNGKDVISETEKKESTSHSENEETNFEKRLQFLEHKLLREITNIHERVSLLSSNSHPAPVVEDKSKNFLHGCAFDILHYNEFSPKMRDELLSSLTLGTLRTKGEVVKRLLLALVDALKFSSLEETPEGQPKIISFVGSTGVGKTTTVAKVAAEYMLGSLQGKFKNISIVSLDNYRIGAQEQINAYGKILKIPVEHVKSCQELLKLIQRSSGSDLFLLDTIGRNPHNSYQLAQLQRILSVCNRHETLLLLNASASYRSSVSAIEAFSIFKPNTVLLTKIDEATTVGGVLSALFDADLPLSFITNGQRVPQDVVKATSELILKKIITPGFEVNIDDLIRKSERKFLYERA